MRYRLLGLALVGGCVINSDKYPRPRDLPAQSIVDGLRILAIQAEPPEIEPGASATVSALLVDPEDTIDLTVWVACAPDRATDFGCPFDPTGLESATPEDLAAQGVIGVEPIFSPVFEAPLGVLDGLEGRQRQEGVNYTLNALALPGDLDTDTGLDFNSVESAFKRIVISDAPTPNHNPGIQALTVDGAVIPEGDVVVVDPGEPYEIGMLLTMNAVETYQYLNVDGTVEERTEEPYVEWYASAGFVSEFNVLYALDPTLGGRWIPPDSPGISGTIWGVLKDRRGGVAWTSRAWRTRNPGP